MLATGGGDTGGPPMEQRDNGNKSHSFMLNLFQNDHSLEPNNDFDRNGKNLQRLCDEHGFAFDNPYFRDETGDRQAAYLRHQLDQQEQQRQQLEAEPRNPNQQVGLLTTQNDQLMQPNDAAREQLHFIEHHISNLHNKQVTSSVKELSILGKSFVPLERSRKSSSIMTPIELKLESERE